jgi:hypothetical protein
MASPWTTGVRPAGKPTNTTATILVQLMVPPEALELQRRLTRTGPAVEEKRSRVWRYAHAVASGVAVALGAYALCSSEGHLLEAVLHLKKHAIGALIWVAASLSGKLARGTPSTRQVEKQVLKEIAHSCGEALCFSATMAAVDVYFC